MSVFTCVLVWVAMKSDRKSTPFMLCSRMVGADILHAHALWRDKTEAFAANVGLTVKNPGCSISLKPLTSMRSHPCTNSKEAETGCALTFD
eukprot:647148-Amphidinium_carterae.1